MSPSLSLAMIVRDEALNLKQCLDSVARHVDEIVIADTGSSDGTQEVAYSYGAKVIDCGPQARPDLFFLDDEATCSTFAAPPPYSGDVALGDFGGARHESFKHATGDFILWVDADDVVENAPELRKVVEHMHSTAADMAFMPYDYARDDKGRVFYRQWRERLARRGCSKWVNPVHEVMLPTRPVKTERYGDVTISHRRKADRKSIPNRNYKILLRQLFQERQRGVEIDPRTLFYLGQEARFIEAERAIEFYTDYLKRSGWPEERASAHCALGQLYEFGIGGGDPATVYQKALREYAAADLEYDVSKLKNPDGVFGAARVYYLQGRWNECINACEAGFAMGNPDSMLGANPMDRIYRPHVYYNHALAHVGRLEDAIASCKAGLAVAPDDPGVPMGAPGMLLFNLGAYEKQLAAKKMVPEIPPGARMVSNLNFSKNEDVEAPPQNVPADMLVVFALQLWKQAKAANDGKRCRALLNSLPPALLSDPVIQQMEAATLKVAPQAGSEFIPEWSKRVATHPAREVVESISNAAFSLPESEARVLDEMMPKIKAAMKQHALSQSPAREAIEASGSGEKGIAQSTVVAATRVVPSATDSGRELSIVFWLGPSIEPWNPETPNKTGIGGSETAAIEMAKELRRRGHQVTVYAECDGEWDGVRYVHWQKCVSIDCDVFICSRQPAIMEHAQGISAKVKLLWVHDIHCGPASPQMERWLYHFDRVLCLSEWHRGFFLQTYPWLDPDKVLVTRNGIDPARFDYSHIPFPPHVPPKANRLHWSSSPNRGLDVLLMLFPEIRKRVPDVELHIYYGFECWQAFATANRNHQELAVIEEYKRRINAAVKEGGVHFHGRVNQLELADSWMRSKVWAYPTAFTETSCISAMEAQAAGCVPVCPPIAALAETVRYGVFPPQGDSERFIDEVVRLLTDEAWRAKFAEPGRKYALENLTWRGLAADWESLFSRVEEESKARPIPIYREVAA